jgi:hypothetical protein
MLVSTVVAFLGIGLAYFFFIRRPDAAEDVAARAAPVHRTLLNKYYVDEFYDAAVVRPLTRVSERVLWKVVDARHHRRGGQRHRVARGRRQLGPPAPADRVGARLCGLHRARRGRGARLLPVALPGGGLKARASADGGRVSNEWRVPTRRASPGPDDEF